MPENQTIRTLLQSLRGSGFTVSLSGQGLALFGQKVVAFENGVVYTVDGAGVAHATVISTIQSVNF